MSEINSQISGTTTYETGPVLCPFIPASGWDPIVGVLIHRTGMWRLLFFVFVVLCIFLSLLMAVQMSKPPLKVYAVTLDRLGHVVQQGKLPAPSGKDAIWVRRMRLQSRDVTLWHIHLPPPSETRSHKTGNVNG